MTQISPVTRWLLTILLAFCQLVGLANTLLVWPDNPSGQLYRIDVEKKTLEMETQPNVWQVLGAVQMKNIAVDAFPPSTRITCLPGDKDRFRLLLVDCTQQVYRFDYQTRSLERLDKTFFRGYNCFSTKFIRKDTLYSFGGYGFWHTNNIQSYYKAFNQEWESLNPSVNAPRSIYRGFNGYLPETDRFFSALSFYQNDSENKGAFTWNDSVYAYSFKAKTWERLGQLTSVVRQQLQSDLIQKASWFQAGSYFILKYYESPQATFLIVDPVSNEARIWKDTHKLLANQNDNYETDIPRCYVLNDTLYFRREVMGFTEKQGQIIQFSITDLWRSSLVIGTLYEPIKSDGQRWLYSLLGAILFVSIGVIFWLRKSGKAKTSGTLVSSTPFINSYPNSLTSKESDVFNALLRISPSDTLTGERLNEILAISDKSLENQRKIRADVIKGLTLKLRLEWGINEAVERVPTAIDQRMFTYALKAEVLNRMKDNQNDYSK